MVYIYTLSHPTTGTVRYVGKTTNVKIRYNSHIHKARGNGKTHLYNWIRTLLSADLKPIITVIEETNIDVWSDRETFWISHYRNLGCDLCNRTDGGEGIKGLTHSPEALVKMSVSHSGSNNHFYGKTHSQETRDLLSKLCAKSGKDNPFYGKKHTEQTKQRLSRYRLENPIVMVDRTKLISKGGSKTFRLISPSGNESIVSGEIKSFCETNNLDYRFMISNAGKGIINDVGCQRPYRLKNPMSRTNCLGWTIEYLGRGKLKERTP